MTWVCVCPATQTWPLPLERQVDVSITAKESPLRRGVGGLDANIGLEELLRDRRVEGAGDEILNDVAVVVAEEGADLNVGASAGSVRAEHPDVDPAGPARLGVER